MLVKIPTIYDVLKYEASRFQNDDSVHYSEALRGVCVFIHNRGVKVLNDITLHTTEAQHIGVQEGKKDWLKVCRTYKLSVDIGSLFWYTYRQDAAIACLRSGTGQNIQG